eukprot:15459633-Alexandrium_andersonii.AAC.1
MDAVHGSACNTLLMNTYQGVCRWWAVEPVISEARVRYPLEACPASTTNPVLAPRFGARGLRKGLRENSREH